MNVGLRAPLWFLGIRMGFSGMLCYFAAWGRWPYWLSGECIMNSGELAPPGLRLPFSFCWFWGLYGFVVCGDSRRIWGRLWFSCGAGHYWGGSISAFWKIFSSADKSSVTDSLHNSYIPCLLIIIMLRFTCGERKICSIMKKSQNIMNMIVVQKLF